MSSGKLLSYILLQFSEEISKGNAQLRRPPLEIAFQIDMVSITGSFPMSTKELLSQLQDPLTIPYLTISENPVECIPS